MPGIDSLWSNLAAGGDRPFLIRPEGTVSHGAMKALVASALSAYRSMGLSPGERVAVLFRDEAKAAAAFTAALFGGLVPVMLAPDSGHPRVEAICHSIAPAFLARDDSLFAAGTAELPRPAEVADDALAYLLFTSGTTAAPAGVEITRANLFAHLATLIRLFGFDPSSRVFNPTPLAHTDGLVFGLLLTLATGGAVIRPGPLDLSAIGAWTGLLSQHRATHMVTNPTVLSLIDRTLARSDCFAFPGFRAVLSSASQLRPAFWRNFEERFGVELFNLYGLTETVTSALYAGRHPEMGPPGTLGRPVDCEARLAPSPELGTGELEIRGEHVFRGYWRNAERSAAAFTPDGFLRTGDMARRNADGSYVFLGRIKAAINTGGTLIRPEEIDECLLGHPAVAEAVTVGLPDDTFEEIAASAVVLKMPVSEAELTAHCQQGLEQLKVPKRIIALAQLPRGAAGKPDLQAVRGLLAERLAKPHDAPSPPDGLEEQLIGLAALVFRAEASQLSLASSPTSVAGWDSFTHVNLVLQAEDEFGVRIAGSLIGSIRSLGDLHELLRKLRAEKAKGGGR